MCSAEFHRTLAQDNYFGSDEIESISIKSLNNLYVRYNENCRLSLDTRGTEVTRQLKVLKTDALNKAGFLFFVFVRSFTSVEVLSTGLRIFFYQRDRANTFERILHSFTLTV